VGLDRAKALLKESGYKGERVVLLEFPIAPRTLADVALRRELAAPAPARAGLELVFADAWRAPFAPTPSPSPSIRHSKP